MKNRILAIIALALIGIILIPTIALASDITGAKYLGTVRVTNSGTAATSVSTVMSLSTAELINNGYALNGSDFAMQYNGADVAFEPSVNSTYPWAMYVPVIGAGQNIDYNLYLGNVTGGKLRYFPGPGGMTVANSASMALGDNFSIELTDTQLDATGNIYRKDGAVLISSAAGVITAGINPIYSYALTVTKDGAYHDLDVSAYVASDANGVILEVYTNGTPEQMSFRKNGSTDDRYYYASHTWVFIGLDASRIFEYKIVNAGSAIVCLRGYTRTGGGWTFNTNATDVSIAAGAYTNIDISATSPAGTVGVIVQAVNKDAGTARGFAVRKDGSANDRVGNLAPNQQAYAVIGVDPATRIFEGFAATVDVDFYVIGYVTAGSVFATNATDKSIAVAGWTDIDASAIAPAANYVFVEVYDAGGVSTTDVGFRKNGSTEDIYTEMDGAHTWAMVETDTVQIFEGQVAAASLDFFVVGYSTAGIYPIYPITTTYAKSVTATPTVAEHDYKFYADGTNLRIDIDSVNVSSVALAGASVTATAASHYFCESGVIYTNQIKVTTEAAGGLAMHHSWAYLTTWIDQSGNGNTATPTFRTASSDADVSASLISYAPVTQARVGTFALSAAGVILSGTPGVIPQMYTELDVTHVPFGDAVNVMLDEGDIPQALWWFPFIFFGIGIIGLLAYGATSMTMVNGRLQDGAIDGSLLTMCIVVEVLFAVVGIIGLIPFWPAILFPIPAAALILSRKHYSWG